MKTVLALILFLASTLSVAAEGIKVVYHLNEKEKAGMLIASVNELRNSAEVSDIRVVVHGPAILRLSKKDQLKPAFQQLIAKGVSIGVCSHSMIKRNYKHQQIIDEVDFIEQGGVLEIIKLQRQGYSYIKI